MQIPNSSQMSFLGMDDKQYQIRMRELDTLREIELAKIETQKIMDQNQTHLKLTKLTLTTTVKMSEIDLERQMIAIQQESFKDTSGPCFGQSDVRPPVSVPQKILSSLKPRHNIAFDNTLLVMRKELNATHDENQKARLQTQIQAFASYCDYLNSDIIRR